MAKEKEYKVKKKKMTGGDIAFHIGAYLIFGLILIICAYPFYYLMICTISDNRMVDLGQIRLLPSGIHFDNYVKVMNRSEPDRHLLYGVLFHQGRDVGEKVLVQAGSRNDVLLRGHDPGLSEQQDAGAEQYLLDLYRTQPDQRL